MSPITVILAVAGYFALLALISFMASRGSDNATFFSGGKKMPWLLVAIATVGAPISGVTFISVPGMVAAKSHGYLQMALGFIAGYIVIAYVLVPLFYKKGLTSIYGYLGDRFGKKSYKSGAWIFFVSKMLGAAVRFFVVCSVLQILVFGPLGIPFELNVIATIALIWLYTSWGGVKSVIWTDVLKSVCLVGSVIMCIVLISSDLGMDLSSTISAVKDHESSQIFFFEDAMSSQYFWKQFIAGVFMVIAMTGLDQDMMQRNLACKDSSGSKKNMILSSVIQFFVIGLFLVLGTLLLLFMDHHGMSMPEKSDDIFGMVASHPSMPVILGIVFVVGLISAAYSAAGSALTSLTTSFSIDILGIDDKSEDSKSQKIRKSVHIMMTVIMGLVIIAFYHLSSDDAISAVYTLASYTYGPILGLFAYGLLSRSEVRDSLVPAVCIGAPLLAWFIQWWIKWTFGYETGFELLLLNAGLTMIGLKVTSILTKKGINPTKSNDYVKESV
ncbi:MAG: sodium:solute symporter [Paramuribaculum sp.]|nr:sodium:solute symporter [Paramuribaculum sp.]